MQPPSTQPRKDGLKMSTYSCFWTMSALVNPCHGLFFTPPSCVAAWNNYKHFWFPIWSNSNFLVTLKFCRCVATLKGCCFDLKVPNLLRLALKRGVRVFKHSKPALKNFPATIVKGCTLQTFSGDLINTRLYEAVKATLQCQLYLLNAELLNFQTFLIRAGLAPVELKKTCPIWTPNTYKKKTKHLSNTQLIMP